MIFGVQELLIKFLNSNMKQASAVRLQASFMYFLPNSLSFKASLLQISCKDDIKTAVPKQPGLGDALCIRLRHIHRLMHTVLFLL